MEADQGHRRHRTPRASGIARYPHALAKYRGEFSVQCWSTTTALVFHSIDPGQFEELKGVVVRDAVNVEPGYGQFIPGWATRG